MAANVSRWRRYGKDRLYVKAPDGTTLGFRPPTDVTVVDVTRLTAHLRHLPPILTDQEVETIFAVARRSTTWQPHR